MAKGKKSKKEKRISAKIKDVATPFEGEICGCEKRRKDGIPDLRVRFDRRELVAELGLEELPDGASIELVVSGNLVDGTPFEGRDCVVLASKKRRK